MVALHPVYVNIDDRCCASPVLVESDARTLGVRDRETTLMVAARSPP
jgi:hypothetical protein